VNRLRVLKRFVPVFALMRGRLSEVLARVSDPAQRTAFTLLVGVSDGAEQWQVDEALRPAMAV